MQSIGELPAIRDQICRIKETDDIPIVLVGNKCDLESDRVVSKNRAKFLAKKWGNTPLYETSAKKRINVDQVFLDLCRQMIKQQDMLDPEKGKKKERESGKPCGGEGSVKASGRRKHGCHIL